MTASFIMAEKGISRDEERDYARALQFMGYDAAVLFCHSPLSQKTGIPQIALSYGELLDKDNNRRITRGIPCLLNAMGMEEEDIARMIRREKVDIICGMSPQPSVKRIMQYPSSTFSEAFYNLLNEHSVMLGFSHHMLKEDRRVLEFNIYNALLARKNGVRVIFNGFSRRPSDIRAIDDYRGLSCILGFRPDYFIRAKEYANDIIARQFHASFGMAIERKL